MNLVESKSVNNAYEMSDRISPLLLHHSLAEYTKKVSQNPTQWALVSRIFACGASPIKLYPADATDFVFWHVPFPGGDCVPFLNSDLH